MFKAERLFRAVMRNAAIPLGGCAVNGILGLAAGDRRACAALKTRLVVAVCNLAGHSSLVRQFGVIGAKLASIGASVLLGTGMLLGVVRWRKELGHAPMRPATPVQRTPS